MPLDKDHRSCFGCNSECDQSDSVDLEYVNGTDNQAFKHRPNGGQIDSERL